MADSVHPDRAAIESAQLEQLRSLVAELIPANKFYTQKLQAAGVGFDVASLADFSARFPFTTKSELVADQQAHLPYGTNLTYPLNRYTRCHQTSGTTGTPLRWLDTPESWNAMTKDWVQVFRAAGVEQNDRILFAFSFGPFLGFWLAFEAGQRIGALCFAGGGMSSTVRLKLLLDYAPHLGKRHVPDPYYGGAAGFEEVLDLVEAACDGLVASLRKPAARR